jgi:hypothetical protein
VRRSSLRNQSIPKIRYRVSAMSWRSTVGRTAGTNTNSATVFKCPVDKTGRSPPKARVMNGMPS